MIYSHIGLYPFPIKCSDVVSGDDNKTILGICAEYDPSRKQNQGAIDQSCLVLDLEKMNKIVGFSNSLSLIWYSDLQGILHYVAESSPGVKLDVKLFEKLFISEVGTDTACW